MSNTLESPLGVVVSAATGTFIAREGFDAFHKFIEFMTGDNPVWTHQIPRILNECREPLFEQFPWMRDINFPEGFDDEASAWSFLDELEATHGATVTVTQLTPNQFRVVDPIQEAVDMMGADRVIVIQVD
jgi:hypothetical protein